MLTPLRRLIYPAPAWDEDAATRIHTTKGGAHLIHSPAPEGARTVVYLHGNGSDLFSIHPLAALFGAKGLGFAAVEYPGYGPAAGQRISQRAILEAAVEGLSHLRAQGLTARRTVLVGESLGSSVAAHLAADGQLRDGSGEGRLVLVSPFTSMVAMVQQVVRGFPAVLVPDRWDTQALAARIDVPTLLVHGEQDEMVPPRMSASLAGVIPDARRVTIPGRTHNDLWEPPSGCLQAITDFATP